MIFVNLFLATAVGLLSYWAGLNPIAAGLVGWGAYRVEVGLSNSLAIATYLRRLSLNDEVRARVALAEHQHQVAHIARNN